MGIVEHLAYISGRASGTVKQYPAVVKEEYEKGKREGQGWTDEDERYYQEHVKPSRPQPEEKKKQTTPKQSFMDRHTVKPKPAPAKMGNKPSEPSRASGTYIVHHYHAGPAPRKQAQRAAPQRLKYFVDTATVR